jgi:hypothetical protein
MHRMNAQWLLSIVLRTRLTGDTRGAEKMKISKGHVEAVN